MQILMAALIAVLVFLQYLLWVAEDGVRQTFALRVSVQAQTEENAALNERNRALEADIKDLKTGLVAIEERARSEIGMIRRDETFYRLLEQPLQQTAPPAKPQSTKSGRRIAIDHQEAPRATEQTGVCGQAGLHGQAGACGQASTRSQARIACHVDPYRLPRCVPPGHRAAANSLSPTVSLQIRPCTAHATGR